MNITRSQLDLNLKIRRAIIVIYSPDLLKLMGIKITSDIITDNHINNEQKLWRHVILNAFEDTRIESIERKPSLNKTSAHYWIVKSEDFDQICWWAGWEPDDVRYRYIKALKKGDIKFKRKNFLWFEYDKLFKRLKEEKDSIKRRELRRQVENKRRQIMLADNVYVDNFLDEISS